MATPSSRKARRKSMNVRMAPLVLRDIRKAAEISDMSINKFIVKHAAVSARTIIEQHLATQQSNAGE